jgi:calcium-dependent protein kinase
LSDVDIRPAALKSKKSASILWEQAGAETYYNLREKIGEGAFGEVWMGDHKESLQPVAIKRILMQQKDFKPLLQELTAFERLSSPYIVRLHEVLLDENYFYMVMDLCTGGDLQNFLATWRDEPDRLMRKMENPAEVKGLPADLVGNFLWQMLAGISYMHHHRFCHRDIKLQNYMVKEDSRAPTLQLVDFGLTVQMKKTGELLKETVGTIKYMAPEVLAGSYTEKCDIWSIGIVVYILCMEKTPWGDKKSAQEVVRCIRDDIREPWPPSDKPKSLKQLINAMLLRNFEDRPRAKDLLRSSKWLKSHKHLKQGSQSCCLVS